MSLIEENVFAHVIGLPPTERSGYLDEVCVDDPALRERLVQLLSAHEAQGGFLDVSLTQDTEHVPDFSPGELIGSYRLIDKLGEGGFGVVFAAEQLHPIRRKVAIKVIKPGMNSRSVVAKFEGERQALAIMDHPNIAKVFDAGTSQENGRPYFVMELVKGIPITEYCVSRPLSVPQKLELFITVCNAIHHAHQKGIIHRDIKPSNVLVAEHDGKPTAKVIDFGVAKALQHDSISSDGLTLSGTIIGTPQYMSPEQADLTNDVDIRSDIYSLAVVLYELLTGTTPLDDSPPKNTNIGGVLKAIREGIVKPPSAVLQSTQDHQSARELQRELDWIVLKGLDKDRDRRYESAKDLAADLGCVLNDQTVTARPPSLAYSTRKFARRNRIPLIVAGASAVVLATIIWGVMTERFRRNEAVKEGKRQLENAIIEANDALVLATKDPGSDELWTAADLMTDRIATLVADSSADAQTVSRAENFLERFSRARQDHEFTFSVEKLLVSHSTNPTFASLVAMEQGLLKILLNRGYDIASSTPPQFAEKLRSDHAPIKLTDALELWLATKIKLAETDSEGITDAQVAQWTDAMCSADPNPLRAAIRSTIFRTVENDDSVLRKAVAEGNLSTMCARKLSWLSQAFLQIGDPVKSAEIRNYALTKHSNDLLLNFENASRLMSLGRTDEAIRYFMRCTSIRPGMAELWIKLAEAFSANHEHEEAISAAKRALSLDSAKSSAWKLIGRANMALGKYQKAIDAFRSFPTTEETEDFDMVNRWIDQCNEQLESKL